MTTSEPGPTPDTLRAALEEAHRRIVALQSQVNSEPWDGQYRNGYNRATEAALAHLARAALQGDADAGCRCSCYPCRASAHEVDR